MVDSEYWRHISGGVCGWNRVRLGRRMSKDGEASSSGWMDGWMDAVDNNSQWDGFG